MKELIYQVEFLSDIVLPASSNTDGNIQKLDFIPGSNFLGMVAKNYDKFEDSFKVFHSGAVKFGDAAVLKDGKPTYKMPLSYFHEKLEDETIYNHHKIEDFTKFEQLKQKRSGFITEDKELIEIDYHYSQKSAYDKSKRRSKDSSMYGYNAIARGTKWQFGIKYDDTITKNDLELIKSSILGTQRFGKSKSSQYGLINIEFLEEQDFSTQNKQIDNEVVLYLNSRVALFDDTGSPTYELKYLFAGLEEENIAYDKCQIRTSTFTPYNSARKTKDYERVCINKGSVIVLNSVQDISISNFVGAYQSEGFGEILLNPKFLEENGFKLKKDNKNNEISSPKIEVKSDLAKFLQQRQNSKQTKLEIGNKVAEFKKDNKSLYSKIKNSQWGTIRSICTKGDTDFKEKIKEYISSGKEKWEQKQIKTLLDASDKLEFYKLLSIQMPKEKEKKEQNND
jgi:hypothetical protein